MEFDLINDLISDTISRFFITESSIQVIDDFKGLFSSNSLTRKSSNSIQLGGSITSLSSQQQSTSQSFRTQEASPYNKNQNLQGNTMKSQQLSTNSGTPNNNQNSGNVSQSLNSNSAQQYQQANSIDSQKFSHVAQKNNLFDQSKQPLTPELWIQREGPNKLKEAQQRLNLNLSRVSRSDLEQMSLDQLTSEKKKVKQELKMYDASFQTHFNRFPVKYLKQLLKINLNINSINNIKIQQKQEKEPLRPLYIYYKKLKQFMQQKGVGSLNDDNDEDISRQKGQPQQQQQPRQQNKTAQQPQSSLNNNNNILNDQQVANINKQIEDLKKTRADLRDKLHTYQSEFFKNHNRRIRYHRDIQPVENEYKQYKETKQELLRLESLVNKQ